MATEEIGLNAALAAQGAEVVETELTREDAVVIEERNGVDADASKEEGMFGRISARWRRPET